MATAATASTGHHARLTLSTPMIRIFTPRSFIYKIIVSAASALRCVAYKSFTTLINTSYSMSNCASNNCESGQDAGVLSNPLSFLRSGYFYWVNASLRTRGGDGYYWSPRSNDTTYSSRLVFHDTYLDTQYSSYRGTGFAVRCESNPMVWWSRSRFYMSKRLAITYLLRRQILLQSH